MAKKKIGRLPYSETSRSSKQQICGTAVWHLPLAWKFVPIILPLAEHGTSQIAYSRHIISGAGKAYQKHHFLIL